MVEGQEGTVLGVCVFDMKRKLRKRNKLNFKLPFLKEMHLGCNANLYLEATAGTFCFSYVKIRIIDDATPKYCGMFFEIQL